MHNQHVCAFCRKTGKNGAQWLLHIGSDTHRVHRPCGEELMKSAPAGAKVSLQPSSELRASFHRQRVGDFWKKNFRGKPAPAAARENQA